MSWLQKTLELPPFSRGFHLIDRHIEDALPELKNYKIALLHCFICHTSASLCINENADPSVRGDFERHMNVMIPESAPHYVHTYEGSDDMPAHLKASVLGTSVSIPVNNGHLLLGTWQGVYLGEHRNYGGRRRLVLTLQGELKQ